jgi:hypothetical protein
MSYGQHVGTIGRIRTYPEHVGCRLILARGFRVQCSFKLPSTAPLVFFDEDANALVRGVHGVCAESGNP